MATRKGNNVGVISGKGGVGKSVTVVNLGCALAETGKRVILVDGDFGNPSVGVQLGLSYTQTGVQDVLAGRKSVVDALVVHPATGVRVLPASLKYTPGASLSRLKRVLNDLNDYDFVLVDSPPGITSDVIEIINAVDEVLVIVTPDLLGVMGATKIVRLCKKHGVRIRGIVLNRVTNAPYEVQQDEIEKMCGEPVVCRIPEDDHIPASISVRTPVVVFFEQAPSSKRIKGLAQFLCGKTAKGEVQKQIQKQSLLQRFAARLSRLLWFFRK